MVAISTGEYEKLKQQQQQAAPVVMQTTSQFSNPFVVRAIELEQQLAEAAKNYDPKLYNKLLEQRQLAVSTGTPPAATAAAPPAPPVVADVNIEKKKEKRVRKAVKRVGKTTITPSPKLLKEPIIPETRALIDSWITKTPKKKESFSPPWLRRPSSRKKTTKYDGSIEPTEGYLRQDY